MSMKAANQRVNPQHAEESGAIELEELRASSPRPDDESRDRADETNGDVDSDSNVLNRSNKIKILVAGFSFFFSGANDGSLGALMPYILRTYDVGTEYIALIYASTFLGWILAASTNTHMARCLGLGSILTAGTVLQLVGQILRFWNPPFALFVVTFFIQAVGKGYQDTHSNTFVTAIKGAHRWLGFIHACYALGGLTAPFVATAIASRVQERWTLFYTFLVGLGTINTLAVLVAFWDSHTIIRKSSSEGGESRGQNATQDIKDALKSPALYLLSTFYFFLSGVGITAGGWVVEYLVSARDGKLPDVGYVPAGLAGGIFLGRVFLAEPTHRFGERRMIMGYCVIILALQLVFWLVPNLISSAIAISFIGFFFGPMFATGMSIGSKLFPKHIQPTALGFLFVLSQGGGALFPSLTGVIASRVGVKVMQPILVGLIVAMGGAWVLVPKVPKRSD